MGKSALYPRLAVRNIRLNKKFYLPYILTCAAAVAMFYIICFLAYNDGMSEHGTLLAVMQLGIFVVAIFSAIILLYTNSFLMKRRQKELGLYNVLGMGKGNIAAMLVYEALFTFVISLVVGIALGIIFSKLVLLLLGALVRFEVPYGFEISTEGVIFCAALFAVIFLITLISNLIRIKRSKPVELLHGGEAGEKEPKTKWVLAILGFICLAAGYYIAITTETPSEALMLFFLAVLLVIAGTYLLFTAGSIAILKGLKGNKRFYYQTRHFIPVSGMIYRMKQNAVGLASICILATMVLVMVSGTVCMYLGTEDAIDANAPNDIMVSCHGAYGDTVEGVRAAADEAVAASGLKVRDKTERTTLNVTTVLKDGVFETQQYNFSDLPGAVVLTFMTAEQYSALTGDEVSLAADEAAVFQSKPLLTDSFGLFDKTYRIAEFLTENPVESSTQNLTGRYCAIVVADDAVLNSINEGQKAAYEETSSQIEWYYGIDLEGTDEEKQACCDSVSEAVSYFPNDGETGGFYSLGITNRVENSRDSYAVTGGFLFLGLFLGLIFVLATVLIIYYKQLSEGYDDAERFEIMQRVGLSRPEIKKAIRSQILMVFFLPLLAAVVHICFAFGMIVKMLAMFNLTNTTLFAICTLSTVAVFAVIYLIVYLLTAKVYYKLVSE